MKVNKFYAYQMKEKKRERGVCVSRDFETRNHCFFEKSAISFQDIPRVSNKIKCIFCNHTILHRADAAVIF